MKQNTMKGRYISQICAVSNSVQSAMDAWIDIMGVGPWKVLITTPDIVTYSILANDFSPKINDFKGYCALAMVGNAQLEIGQPIYGDKGLNDFLTIHGNSWNHIKEHVPRDEVLKKGMEYHDKKGMDIVNYGKIDEDQFLNIATYKKIGVNFELGNTGRINLPKESCYFYPEQNTNRLEKTSTRRMIGEISCVTDNMDNTLAGWADILEVGPWMITHIVQDDLENIIIDNEPYSGKLEFIRAFTQFGDKRIEIIQPISGVPVLEEFLNKSNRGIHHITERVTDSMMEKRLEEFKNKGIGVTFSAQIGKEKFYYMDTAKRMGCRIAISNFQDPTIGKERII